MADRDLPVWTISPNWSDSIIERLEWMTDVLSSRSGAEQRAAVRLTPRRTFEFKVNPIKRERSYLELWLHRLGANECLLPLWHDRGRLSAGIASGVSRIPLDTTYREFEEGGLALLLNDASDWELVEIATMDDTGLDTADPTFKAWGKGASIYPLRVCTMDAEVTSTALTGRVGETKLTFTTNRANPLTPAAEPLTIYDGLPVVSLAPNRMDALETHYARIMEEMDQGIGRRRRYDENPRAFPTQFYNWKAKGRQEHALLRDTLYRLGGRRNAVWLPTFNEDVTIAADLGPASANLDIEKIGYKYLGDSDPLEGKRDILIRDDSGTPRFVRVNSAGIDPAPGQERLVLSAAAGFTASEGRTGSFMATVRLDQDLIEITHHTDSDGLCETSAAFKVFANTRSITGPLVLPTPALEEGLTACGTPEPDRDGACLPPAGFDGWYWRFTVEWEVGGLSDNAKPGNFGVGPRVNTVGPDYASTSSDLYTTTFEHRDPGGPWTDIDPTGTEISIVNQTSFGTSGIFTLFYQHWTWENRQQMTPDSVEHPYDDSLQEDGRVFASGVFPRGWTIII